MKTNRKNKQSFVPLNMECNAFPAPAADNATVDDKYEEITSK